MVYAVPLLFFKFSLIGFSFDFPLCIWPQYGDDCARSAVRAHVDDADGTRAHVKVHMING
jgi:hypothetical protein